MQTAQQLRKTINGHTITLKRNPAGDTTYHTSYAFTLTLPDGTNLFGKPSDTVGIPLLFQNPRQAAALAAFAFVTIGEWDTDAEFFAHYTPAELAFRDSYARELLSNAVSDIEEKLYATR